MTDLSVSTDGVTAFGATAASMAAEMTAAAAGAAAAGPMLLGPVFGLIGGDFVAAFATAHAAHTASIAELSGVLGSISTAAGVNAAGYVATETSNAAGLGAVGSELT
ncbi:type VII secretion target [Rhodococcus sp. NPDC058521]|uniref:type VII secretion target n=1 Tax=Rhodococcus sp. NPDC058521 TaxID=3346536 RepID=UPI00364F7432